MNAVDKPTPLNILFLEDNENDVLLLIEALENGGLALVHDVADSLESFERALGRTSWDIIIADYSLGNQNGSDCIEKIAEKGLDIPVIMVSGAVGEETAVEVMRAGARDFITKNNLSRLIPAIERELKESLIRRSQREEVRKTREAELRLSRVAEYMPALMVACDRSHNIIAWNRECQRLTGYSLEDIQKMEDPVVFLFPALAGEQRNVLNCSSDFTNVEMPLQCKDGGKRMIAWSSIAQQAPIPGWSGWLFGVDITVRIQTQLDLQKSLETVRTTMEGVIRTIMSMLEARDPYTAGHQQRVSELATAIAVQMGFSEKQKEGIRIISLVHDIGKIQVPSEILSKPGNLSSVEMALIRMHPCIGYEILQNVDFPWPVAKTVLQHHERMDGSGYPDGIRDKDILPESRILAVADVVEAMLSHRPYRAALGLDKALDEIGEGRGTLYDTDVVDACLMVFRETGFTFSVGQ